MERKGNRKRGKIQPKGGREEERDYRGIGETAKRPWEKRFVELKDKGFHGNTLFPDHKITGQVFQFPCRLLVRVRFQMNPSVKEGAAYHGCVP